MSANKAASTPAKKWGVGSFFQQAVAGVESRLDTILAEGDEGPGNETPAKPKTPEPSTLKPGTALSRSSSAARSNDRLQERLARTLAKHGGSGASGNGDPSSSPRASVDSRASLDSGRSVGNIGKKEDDTLESSPAPRVSQELNANPRDSVEIQLNSVGIPGFEGYDMMGSSEPSGAKEEGAETSYASNDVPANVDVANRPTNGYEAAMAQLHANHEAAELRWQEELHVYIERIDALQSKLKYLAQEAAESAKKAVASAEPGSVEKKLLEKDERIALLMEEGQKLSKTELDHRAAIKKLRQQLIEGNKTQTTWKEKAEKAERSLADAEDRAKRAEAAERRAKEELNSQSKGSAELEALTNDRNELTATVADLKAKLDRAVGRAEEAESKAQTDALEREKRQVQELKDDLSSAKVEREISEDRLRREIRDLKESVGREKERSRVLEVELKNEQTVMESKMETLRVRAEEVSSGATGDAQAKLLRQIETLQTQYAVASDNWQGIESTLLSRQATLEAERDDYAKRESDLRRKAREVNIKAKKAEAELENDRENLQELERNAEEMKKVIQKLEQKLQKADDDLIAARKDFKMQEENSEANWTQKLEEERARLQEQIQAQAYSQPRTESPVAMNRSRPVSLEPGSFFSERPRSRRSSTLPVPYLETMTPPRQNSYPVLSPNLSYAPNGASNPSMDTPPMQTSEPDDLFMGLATPATPSAPHSRGINEVISVSTVGAGPSVQLVERMSATVRRLESDRAASKDEMVRLTAQRDEARQEVVELMREVEEKRSADQRIQELQATVEELDQRYQTTLEMLGEKSEQVDELQADITDLKKIYRELVDSTMK